MNILWYGIFLPINSCMDISNIVRSTPKLVLYLVIFQLNLNDLSIEVIEMVPYCKPCHTEGHIDIVILNLLFT